MKLAKLQFQLGRGGGGFAEIFKISEGVPGKQKVGSHCSSSGLNDVQKIEQNAYSGENYRVLNFQKALVCNILAANIITIHFFSFRVIYDLYLA